LRVSADTVFATFDSALFERFYVAGVDFLKGHALGVDSKTRRRRPPESPHCGRSARDRTIEPLQGPPLRGRYTGYGSILPVLPAIIPVSAMHCSRPQSTLAHAFLPGAEESCCPLASIQSQRPATRWFSARLSRLGCLPTGSAASPFCDSSSATGTEFVEPRGRSLRPKWPVAGGFGEAALLGIGRTRDGTALASYPGGRTAGGRGNMLGRIITTGV
jgi:hypothetical protein